MDTTARTRPSPDSPQRQPYLTPSIVDYGDVATLTLGRNGTRIDSNNTATRNNPGS